MASVNWGRLLMPTSEDGARLKPALTSALAFALALCGCAGMARPGDDVTLQILALNDFHGNLEAPRDGVWLPDPSNPATDSQHQAGGAARLASLARDLTAAAPNTILVGAGDLVGASPLLSALFHDEPTIESLSRMGLALSAVGNHEFDEGLSELRRLQDGGCHPQDGCKGPRPFAGAKFKYLAASTIDTARGSTAFPAYEIRTFEGVKVAFIGLTLEGTPDIISPSAAAGLRFRDEAETINELVPQLRAKGAEAIVVLLHEGGFPGKGSGACPELSGPIVEIVPKLDRAVDLVISGHTHSAYVCDIDGRLVTSAGRYGTMLTQVRLTLSRKSGHVVKSAGENKIVLHSAYAEDPEQSDLIESYRELARPLMERPVGRITGKIERSAGEAGESAMGNLVTDAMKANAERLTAERIDVAFMNPGGLREDLAYGTNGIVTYADVFAVQPFDDTIAIMTLTGRELEMLLSQQFRPDRNLILQVSDGFSYAWSKDENGLGKLVGGSVQVHGQPLQPQSEYRIAVTNFLSSGGDGFPAFKLGRRRTLADTTTRAIEAWFAQHSPVSATPRTRIRLVR